MPTLWNKLVENKPASLIGLDVGSASVKMVVGRWEKSQFVMQGAWQMELPESQVQDGDRIVAIQRCLQKSGLKNPQAVCALSGSEVFLSRFQFSGLPANAVRQAVELEAQQVCPFDFDQCVVDYQVMNPEKKSRTKEPIEKETRGFLVLAPRPAVESKAEWLRQAGGKALFVDIEGLAALNCLACGGPDTLPQTRVLLDIGSGFTGVLVQDPYGIPFIRSLPFGGRALLTQTARLLRLPESDCRPLFWASDTPALEFMEALNQAAVKWITDINESLRYSLIQQPGTKLTQIALCGGWALSRPLQMVLARHLPAPVEQFNPFGEITLQMSEEDRKRLIQNGPVFAVAAGLAMRKL